MAARHSKDLLQLEQESNSASSNLESKLFVCKNDRATLQQPQNPVDKPPVFPVPKSQVLGKVKDFLGILSESNKKLMQDAKDNPENYDIEVLSGKESELIEMDLMLGVADLHTPEAVAAAKSAIAGNQPAVVLAESSSESESEDSSDDEEEEDKINEQNHKTDSQFVKVGSDVSERDSSRKRKPKKRTKIVELS